MSWQDVIFTVGQLIFFLALLPFLWQPEKPPLSVAIPTATTIYAFAIAYTSLGLTYSGIMAVITGSTWAVLGLQRIGLIPQGTKT
jgi:hypothetical protein